MSSHESMTEWTSPLHQALWYDAAPTWSMEPVSDNVMLNEVMQRTRDRLQQARQSNTLYDAQGKLSNSITNELAAVGYWGALVPTEYGGCGASVAQLVPWLTKLASVDPTTSGLLAVHSCIGPVNQLVHFGNDEQKRRFLPLLARGERIGVFGLTEPNAGSDLTALRTTAVQQGDQFLVTGEKLFITNLLPGRLMGMVCRIENQNAVLLVDLPTQETPAFELVRYDLHSLQHAHNHGCRFQQLSVPVENRLAAPRDDGLQIAYHGLNRGRVTLCANAAGTLRVMLANLLPWIQYRVTYGQPIQAYQLVQARVGRLFALIQVCELLSQWAAGLLSNGYRGEMEAIIAKTTAADALREAAIEIVMRTHGGRAFLAGHHWGDHLHDYLAPSIYEGENEILLLAFFKALVKPRVKQLMNSRLPELQVSPATVQSVHDAAAWNTLREEINHSIRQHSMQLAEHQLELLGYARRARALTIQAVINNQLSRLDPQSLVAQD